MFVVVTLFAVWLGWEMKYVRERRACMERIASDKSVLVHIPPGPGGTEVQIPFWRKWLGDDFARVEAVIELPSSWPEKEARNVSVLFPEHVVRWDGKEI